MRKTALYLYLFFSVAFPLLASEYEVLFLVDSPGINYNHFASFLQGWAKHPNTKNMDGSVGHAWILLKAPHEIWEGGHSGEGNPQTPTYAESMMLLIKQNDPNPIRKFFSTRNDGYLENGPGDHVPTFAIKVAITECQYHEIRALLFDNTYDFKKYQIAQRQCVTFVQKVAMIASLDLRGMQLLEIPPNIYVWGKKIRLWTDPKYRQLAIATPECLEFKMRQALYQGKALPALKEYRRCFQKDKRHKCAKKPASIARYLKFCNSRCCKSS